MYYVNKARTIISLLIMRLQGKLQVSSLTKNYVNGKLSVKRGGAILQLGSIMTEKNSLVSVCGGICRIGKNVFLNKNSIIACYHEINIGTDTIIGPNVCIYDHDHRFNDRGRVKGDDPYRIGTITIGKNVWIGANCVVLRNTTIGDNSIIGAGCVVKGIIPPNSIVRNATELSIEKLHS